MTIVPFGSRLAKSTLTVTSTSSIRNTVKLFVSQAFPVRVFRPDCVKEYVQAGFPALLHICKERSAERFSVPVFRQEFGCHVLIPGDFSQVGTHGLSQIHWFILAVDLDLLVDDIVDELALDDKLGIKILEIPDFFRILLDWI